ncbi:hypothetical protein J6590_018533 [Homalodisca vitripennis]|nr:hypothetical protein J6590_018533 [Homalodisca vitripennis]
MSYFTRRSNFQPPPIAGQTSCLQGQDRLAFTHPSSSHDRRNHINLSSLMAFLFDHITAAKELDLDNCKLPRNED